MGLITLVLLGLFTLLYLSNSIPKKSPAIVKTLEWINKNIRMLAAGGLIYGFIATFLTPIMIYWPTAMFIRMAANMVLVLMALPYMFDRFREKHGDKVNKAILDETSNLVDWLRGKAFVLGVLGGVMALLQFAVIFR
ncbi:MAG: hypothetical protein GC185_13025 [Alphaproteobacteria bacterium]|nr:hypothetical protein [Alphaproteobacteria bacterium]